MPLTYKNFPKDTICPICGTSENKEACLIPIDGTADGNICEVQPIHVACIDISNFRFNRSSGVIYYLL